MSNSFAERAIFIVLMLAPLGVLPESSFCQRVHIGGGLRGGIRYSGGYHWHGGYYGWGPSYWWNGRYWAYPHPHSWNFAIGFQWGPNWPPYPYLYGYNPWFSTPYYYYPYGVPFTQYRGKLDNGGLDPKSPEKQSIPSPPEVQRGPNSKTTNLLVSMPSSSIKRTEDDVCARERQQNLSATTAAELSQRARNVILALRAMPPGARRRQLDSGLYSDFSAGERASICQESLQSLTRVTEKEHNSWQLAGNRH